MGKWIWAMLLVLGTAWLPASTVYAQDTAFSRGGVCVASGPFVISGVTRSYADLVPSTRRQLSVMGLVAKNVGCVPSLKCFSADNSTQSKRDASGRCVVAARAMALTYSPGARATVIKAIKRSVVVNPNAVDEVHLSMTPGVLDLSNARAIISKKPVALVN